MAHLLSLLLLVGVIPFWDSWTWAPRTRIQELVFKDKRALSAERRGQTEAHHLFERFVTFTFAPSGRSGFVKQEQRRYYPKTTDCAIHAR